MIDQPHPSEAGSTTHRAGGPTAETVSSATEYDSLPAVIHALRGELNAAHTKIDHLETALRSSRRIGAALGVLMARQRISLDGAFDLLRTASQHRNRKLRDLAEDVLYTGTLDHPNPLPPPSTATKPSA